MLLSVMAKMGISDDVIVSLVLQGCESITLNAKVQKRVDMLEMKCSRVIYVSKFDQVRNDTVISMVVGRVFEKAEQGEMKWFGCM